MSFDGWREVKLGEVIDFKNGKKKPNNCGSFPVYGGNGILGYVNSPNCNNAVIIGRVGAYCGSVFYEPNECWVSDNAISAKTKSGNSTKFAYYSLTNLRLNERRIGTGQPLLTQGILNSIYTVYPDLKGQKAIAATLSCLDDKIELNNRINKTLEEMAQAIFKSWFVDFEPFQDGEFEDSELGMIPKGWKVLEIVEIINVKDGTHDSPKKRENGFLLITSKHLREYSIAFNEAYYIDDIDYIKINKRSKVDRHDILISMIGTVGNLFYVQYEKVNFAIKNVGLFKTSERIEMAEYIYLHLMSKKITEYISGRLAGSTQKYISLNELRKIPIVIPDDSILKEFKSLIKPLFDTLHVKVKEIGELTAIRDSLLPKLMSGEILVPTEEVQ